MPISWRFVSMRDAVRRDALHGRECGDYFVCDFIGHRIEPPSVTGGFACGKFRRRYPRASKKWR